MRPGDVPNPSWLRLSVISPNQQKFGDALLDQHSLVALPSVVSTHSWNLLINVSNAAGQFELLSHQRFALDPRLVA